MNKKVSLLSIAAGIFLAIAPKVSAADYMQEAFIAPPDSVRISCYWYWLSGNVTKEGVVKDLESMKKAGITRAFIGNISRHEVPRGKVELLSDEWFDIMHTAMATASKLGIEIGVFNCAGWSQAGGPWITPGQAMRYLDMRSFYTNGGHVSLRLNEGLAKTAQPVRTLAVPVKEVAKILTASSATFDRTQMPGIEDVLGRDGKYVFSTPDNTLDLVPRDKKYIMRSLEFQPYEIGRIKGNITVYGIKGGKSEKIASAVVNRTGLKKEVGFNPYAPITISLPAEKFDKYRIEFNGFNKGAGLRRLSLSSTPLVERYSEKSLAKMFQEPLPYWNEYKWRTPIPTGEGYRNVQPSEIIDVTAFVKNGTLNWDAPTGEWRIIHTFMMPTGVKNAPADGDAGEGLEVDKWSRPALKWHYANFIGRLRDRIPEADREAWKYVICDSYEVGSQNFSDDFFESFKAKFGYDPTPYLPVFGGIVVGDADRSDRFLWDVRRLMADRLSYDHIGGMRDLANRDGMKLWLENYGHWGFPGEFLQYGGQADYVAGEFWGEGSLGNIENRAASSCAHTYGKQKVFAESFTCGGPEYVRYPLLMKQRCDRFFTEGINSTLLHLYVSQPDTTTLPGLNAGFGNEFNVKNTWFSQMDLFTQYLKRCNYLLQQGRYVADVAYFIGEDAPVMTGEANPALPKGHQFDYINAEVIEHDLKVDSEGRLTLPSGTSYRLLVLPPLQTMRPAVLRKVHDLVRDGAVILGSEPLRSPSMTDYPNADNEVRSLAAEIWGENPAAKMERKFGKGMVFKGYEIADVFARIGLKEDFRITGSDNILYSHNHLKDGRDIYFLSNQDKDNAADFKALFRIAGDRHVELWHPTDGRITPCSAESTSEGISAAVKLAPLESVFVVLSEGKAVTVAETITRTMEIKSPWTMEFRSISGKDRIQKGELFDWSKSEIDSIRHYSGEVVYRNTFHMKAQPQGKPVFLEVGKATAMAKVWINGQYAGGVWSAPYRVDISKFVHKGKNKVEIRVVNTWVNRLIGDANLPEDKRNTHCNVRTLKADTPLQSSGITGPATIIY